MQSVGPTESVGGGGWKSLVKKYSLVKAVIHLTRRRCRLKDAAAELKGSADSADPFDKARTVWRYLLGFEGFGSRHCFTVEV